MPTQRQHIVKQEHNEALFGELVNSAFPDWAVTALFYASLHLIEAHLPPPVGTRRHVERERAIFAARDLTVVYGHFRELKDQSGDARYDCVIFTEADVRALHDQRYAPLRRHVRGLLGI